MSLASSTAWSSSRARTTAATGPKVSSSKAVIRGVDVVEHGRRVEPARPVDRQQPPVTSAAPSATDATHLGVQLVAQVAARHRPDGVPSGRIADLRSATSSTQTTNSSATDSATMNRLAAMQLWPPLPKRDFTAASAAASRSASSSTTNGSEPPSSSTLFLSDRPAADADGLAGPLAAGQRHRRDAAGRR